jgi:hypothetical protein
VEPPAVIVATGIGFTTTAFTADVVEQPIKLVTVTLLFPEVDVEIVAVVSPLFHKYV